MKKRDAIDYQFFAAVLVIKLGAFAALILAALHQSGKV